MMKCRELSVALNVLHSRLLLLKGMRLREKNRCWFRQREVKKKEDGEIGQRERERREREREKEREREREREREKERERDVIGEITEDFFCSVFFHSD